MKLLTKEIEALIPPEGSTEKIPEADKLVVAKFFFPAGRGTWYVVEGERLTGGDWRFFGFVVSPLGADEDEWGYFTLQELEEVDIHGLKMERDIAFEPTRLGDLLTT